MKTNNQMSSLTIFRAATLILVVAATFLASNGHIQLDTRHLVMFSYKKLVSDWDDCWRIEFNLKDSDSSYRSVEEMRDSLYANPDQHYYSNRLLSYLDLAPERICERLNAEGFLWLHLHCKRGLAQWSKLRPMIEFVEHYAPPKFHGCALKILTSGFHKNEEGVELVVEPLIILDEFFRAGLAYDGEMLTDEMLNDRVQKMNLAQADLNLNAMIDVADKHFQPPKEWKFIDRPLEILLRFLRSQCIMITSRGFTETGIVNMARAMQVLKDNDLTPRFLRISKYVLICAQFLHQEAYKPIQENFIRLRDETRHQANSTNS